MVWKYFCRLSGIAAMALGCSATSDPATGDLRIDLHHKDPRIRMEAACRAALDGRMDLVGDLIGSLRDRDESVRFFAGIALERLTDRDFGYLSYGNILEREEAVARWERWLRESRRDLGPAEPAWDQEGDPSRIPEPPVASLDFLPGGSPFPFGSLEEKE